MKAKEYAARYLADPTDKTLAEIANDFVSEFWAIRKQRNITRNESCFAVLNELEQKWRSFARLAGAHIKEDGFSAAIEYLFPLLHAVWKQRLP